MIERKFAEACPLVVELILQQAGWYYAGPPGVEHRRAGGSAAGPPGWYQTNGPINLSHCWPGLTSRDAYLLHVGVLSTQEALAVCSLRARHSRDLQQSVDADAKWYEPPAHD